MPNFKLMSHAELVVLCETMWQKLEKLEHRILELETKKNLKKTSLNSSSPPSKDQKVNLELKTLQNTQRIASLGRKGGGRSLHPNPDAQVILRPEVCEHCGAFLLLSVDVIHAVYDKIEIPIIKPSVTRVTQLACTCEHCQQTSIAIPPVNLESGTPFGSSIQRLTLSLRYQHAISFKRLEQVLDDVFNLQISQGGINALLEKSLNKFKPELEKIRKQVTNGDGVMSDETSARVKGLNYWEWVFATSKACLHVIRDSRGFEVIEEFFNKTKINTGLQTKPAFWVSDLFGAQAKNPAEKWQVCIAHQLRDCELALNAGDTFFAPMMKRLFYRALEIHQKREGLAESTLLSYQRAVKRDLRFALAMTLTHQDAKRLQKRYSKIQNALFVFLEHPHVPATMPEGAFYGQEATNNASERRIRWSVVFRKVTNGSRSEWGAELLAAVRSVVNTGVLHGLNAFESIRQALSVDGLLPEVLNST